MIREILNNPIVGLKFYNRIENKIYYFNKVSKPKLLNIKSPLCIYLQRVTFGKEFLEDPGIDMSYLQIVIILDIFVKDFEKGLWKLI